MSFRDYVRSRDLREGLADGKNPVDRFKFGSEDNDMAEDHEKIETELFRTVFRKYPEETTDFLNTIASRGDQDVAMLLRKIRKDSGPRLPRQPQHPSDGDEVVPSIADTGHNPEPEGE